MHIIELKYFAATVIFGITLLTGLLSVSFVKRYRRQLEIGDALANGIFIGAGLFHLVPEAIDGFKQLPTNMVYLKTALLVLGSYFLFWVLEKILLRKVTSAQHQLHVIILIFILSIHAFIAGLTLGISEAVSLISILFVAILAHKGFETFAFVINIYRQIGRGIQLTILIILFALITPAGILLGMLSDSVLRLSVDNALTACFSAIAAGTFFYIGTTHTHHIRHPQDSHHQYIRVIATLIGVGAMGVIGIWI